MTKKYVITTNFLDDAMYLLWQPSTWDDGWTWTYKEVFEEALTKRPEYNAWPHRFLFDSKEGAREFAKSLKLPCRWFITEWQITEEMNK